MIRGIGMDRLAAWMRAVCLCGVFLYSADALGGDTPPAPEMPAHWKVISDFQVPSAQVDAMSRKLGAELTGVRNSVYDVNGKRVQINVIAASDAGMVEKLMTHLRSIKAEDALLKKGEIVYEFVGQNDAFPSILEGRRHLDASPAAGK